MPGTNELLRFCQTDTGTNLLTQAAYSSDSQRLTGNQPGVARQELVNKVLRQTSLMSSSLGQWMAALQDSNVTDGLTPTELVAILDAAFAARFAQLLAAAQVLPVGTLFWWPVSTVPSGWVKRNGAPISRTTYAALFSLLGTAYGTGDGSTTFNVPDDRALFIRGWDDTRGIDGGRVLGSQQSGQNESHSHTASTNTAALTGSISHRQSGPSGASGIAQLGGISTQFDGGSGYTGSAVVNLDASHAHTVTVNGSGGGEARPINRAYMPIIKY